MAYMDVITSGVMASISAMTIWTAALKCPFADFYGKPSRNLFLQFYPEVPICQRKRKLIYIFKIP